MPISDLIMVNRRKIMKSIAMNSQNLTIVKLKMVMMVIVMNNKNNNLAYKWPSHP